MTIPAATTTTTATRGVHWSSRRAPCAACTSRPSRRQGRAARLFVILGRHDECGNGEGDDDRWRSRVLGLAFGESNVMDAVRDELLYGVKDELMGSSDWWGGMVLGADAALAAPRRRRGASRC